MLVLGIQTSSAKLTLTLRMSSSLTSISALELWNEVVGDLVPLILGVSNLRHKSSVNE